MNRLILATAAAIMLGGTTAWTQAPSVDPHHPPAAGSQAPEPAQSTPPTSSSGTAGQQGMMGGMPIMSMMGNMPAMHMRIMETIAGMAGIDHVEGRIAFLRAELKITDAQTIVWNAFADVLRTNAKKLGEVRAAMMPQPGGGEAQASRIVQRLDVQERWLAARLEATRSVQPALTNLYSALSDDQKKIADEIVPAELGMGMLAIMGGPMIQPGQMRRGGH